ncbi:MAG: hypothetical protein NZM44_02505 [Candidatus Calescibacterium sp.]|nr:hypothetical protein [Candidatus Calescibacterium sp.]
MKKLLKKFFEEYSSYDIIRISFKIKSKGNDLIEYENIDFIKDRKYSAYIDVDILQKFEPLIKKIINKLYGRLPNCYEGGWGNIYFYINSKQIFYRLTGTALIVKTFTWKHKIHSSPSK